MADGYLRNWDDLRIFLAVAKTGSFTKAAQQLGTVQSTVGRRIETFERRLGTKLFLRHRSGMKLTAEGLTLAGHAAGMQTIAHQVERKLLGSDRSLVGTIRVTTTDGLAAYWLAGKVAQFHKLFPSLRLEIVASTSWLDLTGGQVDIAIRYERPMDARIVCKKVVRVCFALYATQGYLDAAGVPEDANDLFKHYIIENKNLQLNMAFAEWYALVERHPSIFAANSSATVLAALRSGAGLALIPRFFRHVAPELVELDIPIRPASDVWLLSHPDTNKSARVRAALQYLAKAFKSDRKFFS